MLVNPHLTTQHSILGVQNIVMLDLVISTLGERIHRECENALSRSIA